MEGDSRLKIDRYIGFQKDQIGFREIRAGERTGTGDPAANQPRAKSSTNEILALDCTVPRDVDLSSSSNCLSRSDRLSLSYHSIELRSLHAALSDVADVRQDRVAPIRASLANGTYAVTNQQIAQAMLRDFRA
jgi:flagellar biosynthesis anti-sigma factor FlgM